MVGIIEENYQNTNSLVILDDCASCQSVKNRTSNLVSFAYHGRHAGFSTIVISQQFTAITPGFRLNVDHVLFFYTLDESDWESICKHFLTRLTKKQRNEIYDTLENNEHSYLYIGKGSRHIVKKR